MGHFVIACKTRGKDKKLHQIQENEVAYTIEAVETWELHTDKKEWLETIKVSKDQILFKLDTGSQINILPLRVLKQLKVKPDVFETNVKVTSYTEHYLKVLGKCNLECLTKRDVLMKLEFIIVDTRLRPILGGDACMSLGLIKRVQSIEQENTAYNLVHKYKEVFEGLGCLDKHYSIEVNPEIKPTQSIPRRIPLALDNQVKQQLNQLENQGIIEKVTKPLDWASPMLITGKPKGKLRICIDPRQLNKAIKRPHYQIPTTEILMSKLNKAKIFTVLDASLAFHQIKLDQKSSELCCFATPYGRYKFNRMPFGIKSGPEVFQSAINETLQNLQGVVCYFDDLLIYGENLKEHNERLEAVLSRAKEKNLKFDKGKMQLAQKSVTYIGYQISAEGVKIPQSRSEALKQMKVPTKREELQRFLGIVNHSTRFIPNLADKTEYLRGLLKKNVKWKWDEKAEDDYKLLINCISEAPVLAHFDPNKETRIATDASLYGIGAVLLQEGRPVVYASATLNELQRSYAQIEKELLAIVYALQKFHYYIYGTNFVVETDHKPIVGLVTKPIDKLSSRIQRMVLKLQKYDPKIIYVPGKLNILADALSRNPINEEIDTAYIDTETATVHQILSISPQKQNQLVEATIQDQTLNILQTYIKQGWPKRYQSVREDLKPYWNYKNELYVSEGLIMLERRVVIPKALREEIIQKLHNSHMGMTLCKNRAKETVFWPGITVEIEQFIKTCQSCNKYPRANTKEPLINHPVENRPWSKVGIDIMEVKQRKFITIIDYHSKYPELIETEGTNATKVINILKSVFARHGIPNEIITDNGPPFDSQQIKMFTTEWDIIHTTSSPYYAKSNGMVERTVQTCKNRIRKSLEQGTGIYEVLLDVRTTPHNGLRSPAELLMGRQLRTFIPTMEESLKPLYPTEETVKTLIQNQETQKEYADRGAKQLKQLEPGENVMYRHQAKDWREGLITQKDQTPRSYQIEGKDGNMVRRNRVHIKKVETKNKIESDKKGQINEGKGEEEDFRVNPTVEDTRPKRNVKMPAKYTDYQL